MSDYDWHPVVALRWSVTGALQQQFKRRVSNSRGVWYDEYEWRDVPRQPVDDIPLIKYPAHETRAEHETSNAPKVRTFEHASRGWAEYPIGTIAQQSWTGCKWTKTERGWKAHAGDTFPIPGGADQVLLPESEGESYG